MSGRCEFTDTTRLYGVTWWGLTKKTDSPHNVATPWVQVPANLSFSLQMAPAPAQLTIQPEWKLRLHGVTL